MQEKTSVQEFAAEPDIIMECLFEVYEKEMPAVLSGQNIRHTMIYPFLKMLGREFANYTLEELHKILWCCYCKVQRKETFVEQGLYDLENGIGHPAVTSGLLPNSTL